MIRQNRILLGTVSLFLVVAFALHFSPVKQAYSASCNFTAFTTCRDKFNLQGCIDACPYVPTTCSPGTPPNTDCKETDQACSGACWDRGNTHGASCAASAGCSLEQIQILLRGGTIEDVPATVPPQKVQPPPAQKTVLPPSPTPVTTPIAEVDESFWENAEEVEALVETAPKPITVKPGTTEPATNWKEPPKGLDYAVIKEITGDVQFQLEGQKNWQKASVGMKIWNGSLIQTDFDATVILDFEGISVVKVGELTQISIEKFIKDYVRSTGKPSLLLEIHLGDMNLDVNPGSFTADTQVRAGNTSASIRGTRFGVAYNPKMKISVWEIYDGTIEVTSEEARKKVTLTSSYGKPIKRAEVSDDGEIALKTAIPKDEWEMDKTESKRQDLRILITIGLGAVAVIVLAYMLLRKKQTIKNLLKIPPGRWFR